jgi:transposase
MLQLSEFQHGRIVALKEQELSIRKISEVTGIPKSTIGDCLKKYKEQGSMCRKVGSGRHPILNIEDKRALKRIHSQNPKISAPKLGRILEEVVDKVSEETIRRELHELEIHAYSSTKKPLLSPKNIGRRKDICHRWLFNSDSFWESVIFSDECKFNLYNSDGCSYVWREPHKKLDSKYVETTVKFGRGSVMVWGCFSSKGMGRLVFIEEIMDRYLYLDILRNNLRDSARIMGLDDFTFQHDNDPKHSSKLIKEFLEHEKIKILDWPSQSPDLNPIEHVWAYMKRQLYGKNFKTKIELKDALVEVWNNIPKKFIDNLIKSVPRRIRDVFDASGKFSKY